MWLLPTRSRPENIKRFIEVYVATKATTGGLIIIDNDDPLYDEYMKLSLPNGWDWFMNIETLSVNRIFNKMYTLYPNEPWYGLISDDLVPETDYWDVKLVNEAGNDKIAHANDGIRDGSVPSACVLGGDFVREQGFIFLPELKHFYSDDWLGEVGRRKNILRYLPEVRIIHHHFSNGKAEFDATYQRRDGTGDKEAFEAWLIANPAETVTFCCVNSGNYLGRGIEYVNILFDMVCRNISDKKSFKFHVFTDQPEGYHEAIQVRELPGNLEGWWNKLYLFKKGLFDEGSNIVFLDLDTVIVGGLDSLISYRGDFATLRDFWRPEGLGPAIICWKADGPATKIYQEFEASGFDQSLARGDQEFIEKLDLKPEILQNLYPNQFVSYKTSAQFSIPDNAKIVCFHGEPRPHEVKGTWVEHIWKIGGGSTLALEFSFNTTDEEQQNNVRHSLTLPYENLMRPLSGHVAICGGGPSLKDSIPELIQRQANGQIIWALNNTFNFLVKNGVYPDAQILVDGRAANADFIPEQTKATLLIASQCHPDVFKKAEASGGKIIIWHRYIDGMHQILAGKTALIVGCGSTVGTNALALAEVFSFKNIHLYGYDSSYRDDENHAYEQPLNNGERVIEVICNGQTFKCAPWMAQQVNDLKLHLQEFVAKGMEFTIHGTGLFPYVATLLENARPI